MENQAEKLRSDVSSCFRQLAKEHPQMADAQMLVGASDASASLHKQIVHRSVDVEWIQIVENTLPYLDTVIRHPTVMIEDVEQVTPVELARHISEKSIKHLAQHSNLIQKVEGDQVTPSKILSIYREESILTYENKFINTLIKRLYNFVFQRYQSISKGFGTQQSYQFRYDTHFSHGEKETGANVRIGLQLELDSPLVLGASQKEQEHNKTYSQQVERAEKIFRTVTGFANSKFVKQMGANYIRPPVIRTNAIVKNKNMNACLTLWEYMEGNNKTGYSEIRDEFQEMPSDAYIREMYTSVALQYVQFYNDVLQDQASAQLLAEQHLEEVLPDFTAGELEKTDDYDLQDTHYEKIAPISRLMNSRKKLSEDELKIRAAIDIALKADQLLEQQRLEAEAEARRKAEEEAARQKAEEEEARRKAAEEEARRLAEEAARIAREEEARRLAQEEAERKKAEAEEARRKAAEEEAAQAAREEEAKLVAEELEALRLAAEEEAQLQAHRKAVRIRQEQEAAAQAAVQKQIAEEKEAAENLFYYSRQAYVSLPRKKKKRILTELRQLHEYEDALMKLSQCPDADIKLPTPPANRDWDEIRRWERSVMPQKKK